MKYSFCGLVLLAILVLTIELVYIRPGFWFLILIEGLFLGYLADKAGLEDFSDENTPFKGFKRST